MSRISPSSTTDHQASVRCARTSSRQRSSGEHALTLFGPAAAHLSSSPAAASRRCLAPNSSASPISHTAAGAASRLLPPNFGLFLSDRLRGRCRDAGGSTVGGSRDGRAGGSGTGEKEGLVAASATAAHSTNQAAARAGMMRLCSGAVSRSFPDCTAAAPALSSSLSRSSDPAAAGAVVRSFPALRPERGGSNACCCSRKQMAGLCGERTGRAGCAVVAAPSPLTNVPALKTRTRSSGKPLASPHTHRLFPSFSSNVSPATTTTTSSTTTTAAAAEERSDDDYE